MKNSKKKMLLCVGAGVLALAIFLGFNYYKAQKQRSVRFAAMEEQRELSIQSWKAQGLSDEEIEKKLEEERPNFSDGGEHGSGPGILRMITGGHGGGAKE